MEQIQMRPFMLSIYNSLASRGSFAPAQMSIDRIRSRCKPISGSRDRTRPTDVAADCLRASRTDSSAAHNHFLQGSVRGD